MALAARLPPNVKWDTLSQDQKNYVLAVHASMMQDIDKNVGRMI